MQLAIARLAACLLAASATQASAATQCPGNPNALGVSRTLVIDASDGPRFGTWQYPSYRHLKRGAPKALDLAPGEVVLTFDDGPHPTYTRRILRALGRHCVKATFFPVGRWARQVPTIIRQTIARGHTVGAHTWSHPHRIDKRPFAYAKKEIERGFAEVRKAAGGTIAPFLRFPGLRETDAMNAFAAARGYTVFSTDVTSDDWTGISAQTIVRRVVGRIRRQGRGMILMHDNKPETAKALPAILNALKRYGFRIVHIVPKQPLSGPKKTAKTAVDDDGGQQESPKH